MTRHMFYEWTFATVGVACLMKWMFGDDQDALIVASMSFVLSALHGIRGDIEARVLPPAETDAP
ncbi:MAG TPA: hypothetical protein VJ782_00500 [Aeromicrobium sp.]|nr:hypothetical protein [Aeromicrobium sp.]